MLECDDCGECCLIYWITITKEEKEYLEKFKKIITRQNERDSTKFDWKLKCEFYRDESKHCSIYENRPEVCRKYLCSKLSSPNK